MPVQPRVAHRDAQVQRARLTAGVTRAWAGRVWNEAAIGHLRLRRTVIHIDAFRTLISTWRARYGSVGAVVRPPSQQVLEFLTAFDGPVGRLAIGLRNMVLEEAPHAIEKVYRNHPSAGWFGTGPKMKDMFCYVATSRTHVNLGFCRGASLADPNHVLEGDGKVMRHVKFWTSRDLERPFVRRYIRLAIGQSHVRAER